MAVRPPGLGLSSRLGGRPRPFVPAIIVVLLLIVLGSVFVSLYTDLLWFRETGDSQVFTTVLRTKVLLFVLFGLLMALVVGVNLAVAYRLRPPFRPLSGVPPALGLRHYPAAGYVLGGAALISPSAAPGSRSTARSPSETKPRVGLARRRTLVEEIIPRGTLAYHPCPPHWGLSQCCCVMTSLHREGRTVYRDRNGHRQVSTSFR